MGLDRKNKAEIISTNLQNDQLFVIDLEKDVNIEKIAANKTQVIDFYIVFNANGHIKTMRRLSSEETKLSGNSIDTNNGYRVEPYTTVKGNFSLEGHGNKRELMSLVVDTNKRKQKGRAFIQRSRKSND